MNILSKITIALVGTTCLGGMAAAGSLTTNIDVPSGPNATQYHDKTFIFQVFGADGADQFAKVQEDSKGNTTTTLIGNMPSIISNGQYLQVVILDGNNGVEAINNVNGLWQDTQTPSNLQEIAFSQATWKCVSGACASNAYK